MFWHIFVTYFSLVLIFFCEIIFWNIFLERFFMFKQNKNILILFYFLQSLFLLIIFHFKYGKNFFFIILKNMHKNIIIKDPQELLYILLQAGIKILLIGFFFLVLMFIYIQIIRILRKEEYFIYKICIFFWVYYLIISCILFIYDLNTFHWEIFYKNNLFDFQPDLTTWYIFYSGELLDLILYMCLISMLIIITFLSPINIVFKIKETFIIRILPFIIIFSFSFYFLGGENLFRDLGLILIAFISGEFFIFSKIYWKICKGYKNKECS